MARRDLWKKWDKNPKGDDLPKDPTRSELDKSRWVYRVYNVNGNPTSPVPFPTRLQAQTLADALQGKFGSPYFVRCEKEEPFNASPPTPPPPMPKPPEVLPEGKLKFSVVPRLIEVKYGTEQHHIDFYVKAPNQSDEKHLALEMTTNQMLQLVDAIMRFATRPNQS